MGDPLTHTPPDEAALTELAFRPSAATRLPAPAPAPVPDRPQPTEHSAERHTVAPDGAGPGPSYVEFAAGLRRQLPSPAPDWGVRGWLHRATGGRISPSMSARERIWRAARGSVQTQFDGPRTVVFVNPKGGTATTTSTLLAAGTFGTHRGGGVVAMDAHETRGTLGERARPATHAATVCDLLENIGVFQRPEARVGDLGRFLRGQGAAHFDVLASDEQPGTTGQIDAAAYRQLHELLRRYYQLVLVDTGGNMRAESWQSAVTSADLVVITVTVRLDAASAALWMADALERSVLEAADLRRRCVTLICDVAPGTDPGLRAHLVETFRPRCHTVMRMPYDAALADGAPIDHGRLSPASRSAWLYACAAMTTALSDAAAARGR